MKYLCLFLFFISLLSAGAQRTDTFSIKRTVVFSKEKFVEDTFLEQTYLTSKTEKINRIVYRTGIKIISQNTLIYFKATQSILDSFGVLEDKNANVGEYRKVPCVQKNDSIFFLIKYHLPSMRKKGTMVEIEKAYTGVRRKDAIAMSIESTIDNVPNVADKENFFLYKQEEVITRRRR